MGRRIPSARVLDRMSGLDQWRLLDVWAEELRAERENILSGYIQPWGKATRRRILESNRKRLKRLYALADDFDIGIGQPEKAA